MISLYSPNTEKTLPERVRIKVQSSLDATRMNSLRFRCLLSFPFLATLTLHGQRPFPLKVDFPPRSSGYYQSISFHHNFDRGCQSQGTIIRFRTFQRDRNIKGYSWLLFWSSFCIDFIWDINYSLIQHLVEIAWGPRPESRPLVPTALDLTLY